MGKAMYIGILFPCILLCGSILVKAKGIEQKVQELNDMTAKKGLINLNLHKFKEYVKSPPKDYSFIVMFTAMQPQRKCMVCQEVYNEFLLVANSYRFANVPSGKLFFGIVDFDEGSDVFQMLRLNTAPIITHFPAKGKAKSSDTMDFERTGLHAEAIAKWIQDRTDIPFRVFRPPNYSGAAAIIMTVTCLASFLYIKRDSLDFIYNREIWATIALIFCLSMISGQMWNQIRGPPLYGRGKNGPQYLSGGSHFQFILESYLIAALNGAVVVGMILMIEGAGGVRTQSKPNGENKIKRLHVIIGLVIFTVFFSALLSVFRAKTPGYPYSFLFK